MCSVVVTGGSGFLGQHIVKHLQLNAPWVTDIRVFDLVPFVKFLDYKDRLKVKSYTGGLGETAALRKAFCDATAVIHVASIIDVRFQPDKKLLQKVNVQGTMNVISACLEECVTSLIYCSSISTVQGYSHCLGGTEAELKDVSPLLFRDYGGTKKEAEKLVLNADRTLLSNGKKLRTVSLIPPTMYGEGDKLIAMILQYAEENKGTFIRMGRGHNLEAYAYVGNVAWGFVCCLKSMYGDPHFGNERMFIMDDTPPQSLQVLSQPFLESRGFKLTSYYIPLFLVFAICLIVETFCLLISPFKRISFSLSLSGIIFSTRKFYVKYDKAKTLIKYSPLYSFEKAVKQSLPYYKNLKLKN
ncbi:3 beta-hydroxysteroid dehydrogenase/Delta 5--_4-isomerase type 2-like [Saccostrea echinata]|uniref:3 beta-hydroxysteroid dehydrogenase/Delta 5-->4-isomerase type 2-like n=1 Tax=Saccostrea echinata TaxID=191078 RepID=UPI002A7F6232|nr:3 beta-hydroxysteroid dehydrogenase/Delta 5-->4-isomerase type 2-like [Saccostrea echinata]